MCAYGDVSCLDACPMEDSTDPNDCATSVKPDYNALAQCDDTYDKCEADCQQKEEDSIPIQCKAPDVHDVQVSNKSGCVCFMDPTDTDADRASFRKECEAKLATLGAQCSNGKTVSDRIVDVNPSDSPQWTSPEKAKDFGEKDQYVSLNIFIATHSTCSNAVGLLSDTPVRILNKYPRLSNLNITHLGCATFSNLNLNSQGANAFKQYLDQNKGDFFNANISANQINSFGIKTRDASGKLAFDIAKTLDTMTLYNYRFSKLPNQCIADPTGNGQISVKLSPTEVVSSPDPCHLNSGDDYCAYDNVHIEKNVPILCRDNTGTTIKVACKYKGTISNDSMIIGHWSKI
jgi:hypothetical protein